MPGTLQSLVFLLCAAVLITRVSGLGKRLSAREFASRAEVVHNVAVHRMGIGKHVILCGFGRTGRNPGRFLDAESIPCIALDIDAGWHRAGAGDAAGGV